MGVVGDGLGCISAFWIYLRCKFSLSFRHVMCSLQQLLFCSVWCLAVFGWFPVVISLTFEVQVGCEAWGFGFGMYFLGSGVRLQEQHSGFSCLNGVVGLQLLSFLQSALVHSNAGAMGLASRCS